MKVSVAGIAIASALLAWSCAHTGAVQTTFDRPYPERNASGDPIVAVFVGRIPCARGECEKRKVELVLYGRDEGRMPSTYWLGQVLVGLSNERIVQTGTWTRTNGTQNHPEALVYSLNDASDQTLQHFWRVDNDVLLPLRQDLRPRPGNGAWGYMLSRDCSPYGPRTYPYDERTGEFLPTPSAMTSCS